MVADGGERMVMVLALHFVCTDDVHANVNHADEGAKGLVQLLEKFRVQYLMSRYLNC